MVESTKNKTPETGIYIVALNHLGKVRERLQFCLNFFNMQPRPRFCLLLSSAGAQGTGGALLWRQPTIINTPFSFTSSLPRPHGA